MSFIKKIISDAEIFLLTVRNNINNDSALVSDLSVLENAATKFFTSLDKSIDDITKSCTSRNYNASKKYDTKFSHSRLLNNSDVSDATMVSDLSKSDLSKSDLSKNDVAQRYNPTQLNNVLSIKHKYFWKLGEDLTNIIEKESGIKIGSIDSLINDAMFLKKNNPEYSAIKINYDSKYAPIDMKKELLDLYQHSDKTLKEISIYLENTYGMSVSVSTISRHARKYFQDQGLEFKNRRDVKKYYKDGTS